MREVAERIEAGDPPRDTCSRLAVYADELQRILGERNYWISASDASVEATRSRLAREIKQTQITWMQVGEETTNERRKREAALVAQSVTREAFAGRHGSHPMTPKATIDRLTDQFEDEFAGHIDARRRVQQIWDAAGEFAALADALRAR